jgi:uncharacterized protein with PIN domain
VQRLYAVAAFKCPQCESRMYHRRQFLGAFHRYTQCPQCGTAKLSRLKSIDYVDQLNKNPLRLLLRMFGAPLYHCTFCRLQFWDLRARHPGVASAERRA